MVSNYWLGDKVRAHLRTFFTDLDREIIAYQVSQPEAWEHQLNTLLTLLDRSAGSLRPTALTKLDRALARLGVAVSFDVKITNRSEPKYGNDFAIGMDARIGTIRIEKLVLVQAKRLKTRGPMPLGSDLYDEYKKEQAERMLQVTSSSFYMFFNPANVQSGGQFHNEVGTRVASAASVLAVCGARIPSFDDLWKHQLSLVDFMVDYFLQTSVGDAMLRMHETDGRWTLHRHGQPVDAQGPAALLQVTVAPKRELPDQ